MVLSMRETRFERWEATRQIGKRAYVIRYGVFQFGPLSAFIAAGVEMLIRNRPFLSSFVEQMPLFVLAGVLWGVWMWTDMERSYQLHRARRG